MKVLKDEDKPGYYGLVVSQKELDVITDILGHTESKAKEDILDDIFNILDQYRKKIRIEFNGPPTKYSIKAKPEINPCSDT